MSRNDFIVRKIIVYAFQFKRKHFVHIIKPGNQFYIDCNLYKIISRALYTDLGLTMFENYFEYYEIINQISLRGYILIQPLEWLEGQVAPSPFRWCSSLSYSPFSLIVRYTSHGGRAHSDNWGSRWVWRAICDVPSSIIRTKTSLDTERASPEANLNC